MSSHRSNSGNKTTSSRLVSLASKPVAEPTSDFQQPSEGGGQTDTEPFSPTSPRSSFQSARISTRSNPLLRLASYNSNSTNSTATSKHTAFYTAHSHPVTYTTSYHTADEFEVGPSHQHLIEMAQNTVGDSREEPGRAEYNEDEELVNAMARQYVLDAEAAGSASPSHRSRQNTDASRMATLHSIDASEEDFPPQLPLLKHMLDQQQQQQQRQQHANAGSHVVMPMPMPADAYAYTDEKHAAGSQLGRSSRADQGRSGSVTTGYDEDYESNGGNIGNGPRALSERLRDEEVEDDANEARLFVSARQRYPPPKYSYSADLSVPLGTILFLLGFVLLPLWWIGAVFPRTPNSDVVRTWRKYNALMTLLSLPLLGLFLALGGWQAVHG